MDLHLEAAQILARANEKEGSLKTLVYSSTYKNVRQLFALVSECIKYQAILEEVLSHCQSNLLEEKLISGDNHLAVVLLYEFLIGRGFGKAGFIRKVIVKHKAEIKLACQVTLKNHNSKSLRDTVNEKQVSSSRVPRYARVNLVKCTLQDAVEKLGAEGWIYHGTLGMKSFGREIENFAEDTFGSDPLLNDLLVFPTGTDLHNHPLVLSGVLVLQDKASCIPAHVLDPKPGSVVLDCCAAPGNKTCHLASLMNDEGRVIALDRDLKRMTTMKSLLDRSGFTCIELIHQDFLTISPTNEDASNIKLILVDPSCSGSGMLGARICPSDDQVDARRLESLKRFQISILKHALRFPNVQRVVYSTCSVHQQENEEVVEEIMENVKEYFQFKCVYPELSDSRGLKKFLHHQQFLRLSPEKDLTLGFFVACFERIKSAEKSDEGKDLNRTEEMEEDLDYSAVIVDKSGKKKNRKRKEREESIDNFPFTAEDRNLSTTNELSNAIDEDEIAEAKKHKKKKHKKEKKGDTMKFSSESVQGNKEEAESLLISDCLSHSVDEHGLESIASKNLISKCTEEEASINITTIGRKESFEEDTLCRGEKAKKNKKRKKNKEKEENISSEAISIEEGALEVDDNCLSKELAAEDTTNNMATFQSQDIVSKKRKKKHKKSKEEEGESFSTEAIMMEGENCFSKELVVEDESQASFQSQENLSKKSKKKHKISKEKEEDSFSDGAILKEGAQAVENCLSYSKESEVEDDDLSTLGSQERISKKRKKKHKKGKD